MDSRRHGQVLCLRVAQLISYERLMVLDPHYYQQVIHAGKTHISKPRVPPIVCIPGREDLHWVLAAIVSTENKTTVFYLDSLSNKSVGKEVGSSISKFLRDAQVPAFQVVETKVDRQVNGNDCTLLVVGNFCTIVQIADKTNDNNLIDAIGARSFRYKIKRGEIEVEINDAFAESMYRKVYWAKCESVNAKLEKTVMWWPCRKITLLLAEKLERNAKSLGRIPVMWYKKSVGDA